MDKLRVLLCGGHEISRAETRHTRARELKKQRVGIPGLSRGQKNATPAEESRRIEYSGIWPVAGQLF